MSLAPGGSASRRPKVLIVDDNEVCRAVVRESLELGGFDVVELDNPLA
jgi:CheY-like chemotaxis protein